jgi:hypothetical protein
MSMSPPRSAERSAKARPPLAIADRKLVISPPCSPSTATPVLRALRLLRDEGLVEMGRGPAIRATASPDRGTVIAKTKELIDFARRHPRRTRVNSQPQVVHFSTGLDTWKERIGRSAETAPLPRGFRTNRSEIRCINGSAGYHVLMTRRIQSVVATLDEEGLRWAGQAVGRRS